MAVQIETTRQVNINQASLIIQRAIGRKRPIMLWGAPGIGKSDLIRQIGLLLGRKVIDIRLPLWEPTDMKGIPFYNPKTNKMEWAPPAELPHDKDSNAIVFLDEINGAAPAVQAAAYQLILDRKIGTYKLPDNVVVIAAGNRDSDKGVSYRMPKPLANRFVHLELRVEFDCWHEWAIHNDVHPDVVGYLTVQKQDLYDFDPKADTKAFSTPRSWTFVSELLQDADEDTEWDNGLELDMVSGCVGEGVGLKFQAHRESTAKMPNPTEILDGKVTTLETKEISAMYALTTAMCYELKENFTKLGKVKAWHEQCGHFLQFMMDNFNTEMTIMGARMALKSYSLPFDHTKLTNFKEFFERFGQLVIDA